MDALNNMKLGMRFLLLTVILVAIVVIESTVIIVDNMAISSHSTRLVENTIPILNKTHQLKLSVVQVQQWLTDIIKLNGT